MENSKKFGTLEKNWQTQKLAKIRKNLKNRIKMINSKKIDKFGKNSEKFGKN